MRVNRGDDEIPSLPGDDQLLDLAHRPGIDERVVHQQDFCFFCASSISASAWAIVSVMGFSSQTSQPLLDRPPGEIEVGGHRGGDGGGRRRSSIDCQAAAQPRGRVQAPGALQPVGREVADGRQLENRGRG